MSNHLGDVEHDVPDERVDGADVRPLAVAETVARVVVAEREDAGGCQGPRELAVPAQVLAQPVAQEHHGLPNPFMHMFGHLPICTPQTEVTLHLWLALRPPRSGVDLLPALGVEEGLLLLVGGGVVVGGHDAAVAAPAVAGVAVVQLHR